MIQLKEISGEEHLLENFVERYAESGGFPLSIDYTRRCRAFAFVDPSGRMLGGFLVNLAPPYRSLNDMPEDARAQIMEQLDIDETFEAMCFWFSREMRGSMKMMWIWAQVLFFIRRFPRRDLLGCTVSRSLFEQYSAVPITLLYEGKIQMPHRTLDKFVFLSRGKSGFVRGFMLETWHRTRRLFKRTSSAAKAPRKAAAHREEGCAAAPLP